MREFYGLKSFLPFRFLFEIFRRKTPTNCNFDTFQNCASAVQFFLVKVCRFIFLYYLNALSDAQMAELVDALVSNTNAARRPGSTPGLGTRFQSKVCWLSISYNTLFSFWCNMVQQFIYKYFIVLFLFLFRFCIISSSNNDFPEATFVGTYSTEIFTTHGFDIAINRSFANSDVICQVSS